MDTLKISEEIQQKINQIAKGRSLLSSRAKKKSETIGAYYKKRAKVLIQLRNGVEFEIEGEKIVNPPATLCENIARGICFQEKIDQELAEAEYKNAVVGIQALQAELNGLQSINRHLDET